MQAFNTIKLFCCDLNWTYFDHPFPHTPPSTPQDWAFIDPDAYYDWHINFGNNVMFCQAYTFCGYAFYPTKLGPVAPDRGCQLLPSLYQRSQKDGIPFWSYFCVGTDLILSNLRNEWILPGSREYGYFGFLAPESPWTDLLCARIEEFLSMYPVDWLLFDWFVYGSLKPDQYHLQPTWYNQEWFQKITGRSFPQDPADISAEETLTYKREVLAWQFHRIRDVVKNTSPATKITFNVPYWEAAEPLWVDHPMLNESDGLFAESSQENIVNWLLAIRKPGQRVFTTIIGRVDDEGICDPDSWKMWYEKGCDFFGYAWGTPPDFRPHPSYQQSLKVVKSAFKQIPS